eukprot:scaffold237844_cov49-Tisochrysis_lutea.AAC.1
MTASVFNGMHGWGNEREKSMQAQRPHALRFPENEEHVWLRENEGSVASPSHTQEDCVESVLGTFKLLAQFTVLLL